MMLGRSFVKTPGEKRRNSASSFFMMRACGVGSVKRVGVELAAKRRGVQKVRTPEVKDTGLNFTSATQLRPGNGGNRA